MKAVCPCLLLFLAPLVALAQQTLSVGPVHRYTFNSIAGAAVDGTQISDTIGAANGIIRGTGASFDGAGGLRLTGGASTTAAYIDFPNGLASGALDQTPGYASVTYELWVTVNSSQNYSRILDFGSNDSGEITTVGGSFNGTDYLIVSANVGTNPTIRFERGGNGLTGGATQDIANATSIGTKMHLVVTYDSSVGGWKLYKNGIVISTLTTLLGPDSIPDLNVWLGRSNWSADSNADITYDELRVYNYALNDQQVLGNYQTGPDAVTSNAPPDSYYKFDESSGTSSADSSGGNAVALYDGAIFVAGQNGNALNLNGATGYGRVTNSGSLNPTNAMTIWAWINPADWNGNRVIVEKGAANSQYRLLAENGLLKFEIASPTRAVTAPLPQTGVWSLVVATYDGTWMRVYVNGIKVGEVAASGVIPTTTDDLFIGTSSATATAGEHFSGSIDDLRIYSRAMTLLELQTYIGFPTATIVNPSSSAVAVIGVSDGLHLVASVSGALQTGVQWTKVSGPGTASFSQPNNTDTTVQFSQPGTYMLQITDTSGGGNATAQITIGVKPAPDSNLAVWLKLNETSGTTASDSSGNGKNATLVNTPTWTTGLFNNSLSLSGTTQYVTLPTGIVSSLSDFTISTWVKPGSVSNWSRIFDFGTGTTAYMFLTPQNGATSVPRFAITTSGGAGEQQINANAALSPGTWTHIAVTLSGSTGILYINGVEAGRNSSMTLKPSNLGNTALNYLGRSQYSDPYLAGSLDDFQIYKRALSASEIAAFAISTIAPTISSGSAPAATSGTAVSLNGSVTSESGAVLGNLWSKTSGPGSATFTSGTSAATGVTFSRAGSYVMRLSGSNASAESFAELTVNVSANPNIYDDWIGSAYAGMSDSAVIGATADPDRDGINNLTEWALGLNPAKADAVTWSTGKAGMPIAGTWSDGTYTYLTLQVRRPIGRVNVTYSAEATSDFVTWSAATQVGSPTANGDGSETILFRDTMPREQAPKRFIRLKISQP